MLRLDTGSISIEVDPEHGGRIVSLIAHDREWLAAAATSIGAARDRVFGDGDYVGAGWDEIAPTVHACVLSDGTALQDHGDAWRLPWDVLDLEPLRMSVQLETLPVTLERTVEAAGDTLLLRYRATTSSSNPVPLLWSAHPLFAAPPGTRLSIPAAPITERGSAETEMVEEYPRRGRRITGPDSIDDVPAHSALKSFVAGARTASITHADGATLALSWSPWLAAAGFYWDRGEFSDSPVVAIEPTTGAGDEASVVWADLPRVSAGAPLEWQVTVFLP